MQEGFYRKPDGTLVFRAIASVGIKNAYPCKHGYHPSSWPKDPPKDKFGLETIEAASRRA